MALSVTIDSSELGRLGERLALLTERNIRFVLAGAMTAAAKDAQVALKQATTSGRFIQAPVTKWTENSTYVSFASPNKLAAEVGFKDFASGGTPAGRYLNPLVQGGPRRTKPHERLLWASGAVPRGRFLVPTGVTPLAFNAAGNIPSSKYIQVLSRVKSLREVGSTQNVTGSRRSQAKRSDRDYFVGRPGGLPAGIQARLGKRPDKWRPGGPGRPPTTKLPRGFHTVFYLTSQPMVPAIFPIPTILGDTYRQSFSQEIQKRIQAELLLGKGVR